MTGSGSFCGSGRVGSTRLFIYIRVVCAVRCIMQRFKCAKAAYLAQYEYFLSYCKADNCDRRSSFHECMVRSKRHTALSKRCCAGERYKFLLICQVLVLGRFQNLKGRQKANITFVHENTTFARCQKFTSFLEFWINTTILSQFVATRNLAQRPEKEIAHPQQAKASSSVAAQHQQQVMRYVPERSSGNKLTRLDWHKIQQKSPSIESNGKGRL